MNDDASAGENLDAQTLAKRGYESADVDYKGPGSWIDWTSDEKAELVRDMMGMAHLEGPGWIILGVSEDSATGQFRIDGLTARQIGSFDPSDIGKKAKRHSDPEVRFAVQPFPIDGKTCVAIRVEPFATVPHICIKSSGRILEEGALYIRTAAAETAKVTRAEDMRRLVERATRQHADSIVRQVAILVQQVADRSPVVTPEAEAPGLKEAEFRKAFASLLEEARARE